MIYNCSMAEDLMNINEFRPEPWVAMAVYCQCRNQPDRALMLTDRVSCDVTFIDTIN